MAPPTRRVGEIFRASLLVDHGDRAAAQQLLILLEDEITHEQTPSGFNWASKELLARVLVAHAGALDAADAAGRSELLNRAWTLLDTPEAEGRITVDGKETLAKLAALRGGGGPDERATP